MRVERSHDAGGVLFGIKLVVHVDQAWVGQYRVGRIGDGKRILTGL